MKILMITDGLGRGGKERRMLELLKGLQKHRENFELYLVSLTADIEYKSVYDLPLKFEVIERKRKKDFSVIFKLKRIIKSFQPDIIHSWGTMASVYIVLAGAARRIPFVNGVLADAPKKLGLTNKQYLRVKLTAPFSDIIISNSKAGISAYKVPAEKAVCVYNGVDFNRFEDLKPPSQIEQEILRRNKNDSCVIAMVATFNELKDYETLAKAAVALCNSSSKIIFLFVGDGATRIQITKIIPADLLDTQIFFTGKREDIESVLQIVDIGALITNSGNHCEGISNSIIEYMLSGKPVIATTGGGTDEVIAEGKNGFLVAPRDERQIADRIKLLVNDSALRAGMGRYAREWARDHFNIFDKTEEYVGIYRKLLVRKSKPD